MTSSDAQVDPVTGGATTTDTTSLYWSRQFHSSSDVSCRLMHQKSEPHSVGPTQDSSNLAKLFGKLNSGWTFKLVLQHYCSTPAIFSFADRPGLIHKNRVRMQSSLGITVRRHRDEANMFLKFTGTVKAPTSMAGVVFA